MDPAAFSLESRELTPGADATIGAAEVEFMPLRTSLRAALVGGSVLVSGAAQASVPPVFRSTPFEQAQRLAEQSNKLFLVDATASWCGPCKMMDRTTWTDGRVAAWIHEHAVAVQFDVDKDPKRAGALKIAAMPTVIVFKDGLELERFRGYRSADQLLAWLDRFVEGRPGDAARRDGPAADDIQARLEKARDLVQDGKLDEATAEYAWLWDNMLAREPSMNGVRLSFMVRDMQDLAATHAPARAAFAGLRDRYGPSIEKGRPKREDVVDWIALNKVVGEEDVTLAWFDRIKDSADGRRLIGYAEIHLYELLAGRKRWADAGRILRDPVGHARRLVEIRKQVGGTEDLMRQPEAKREMIREHQGQLFRREFLDLYAACLAAGREREAESVGVIIVEQYADGAIRLELVEVALLLDRPLPRHRRWLDEAEAMGASDAELRARLEEVLGNRS